jgi:hypothetical protein
LLGTRLLTGAASGVKAQSRAARWGRSCRKAMRRAESGSTSGFRSVLPTSTLSWTRGTDGSRGNTSSLSRREGRSWES